MSTEIFKELVTEDSLKIIEEESSKYEGLHVEMEEAEQRKFVKEKASLISGILKKLERARIDTSRKYKKMVETEAESIRSRLEKANKPFTTLISDYSEKCAQILAKRRADEEAKALVIQIESDHGDALTLDRMRTFEIAEEIRKKEAHDEKVGREARAVAEAAELEATERAEQAEKDAIIAKAKANRDAVQAKKDAELAAELAEENRIETERQAIKNAEQAKIQAKKDAELAAENARLAEIKRQDDEKEQQRLDQEKLEKNRSHVGKIRREAKESLMLFCIVDEETAKNIILAISKNIIKNLSINY